ncbi:hypothetical protein PY093_18015 [Cytobacillus sp. S13-E01]|uniref:hypothetical protein n=1 Tax=Cytobacillus sp. S13-E01 TaxID=3031326 RepID=UPI0023D7E9CD|nr:hypothetical protein [Cytobacillus sp. S13-E01]MDF0728533.1 hypothetical protein [Cytobacillus sp. S13-E01]
MEWALAIIFGIAILLLIFSFMQIRQSSKIEKREIDLMSIHLMEEINKLEKQIRDIELDAEITAHEAGVQSISSNERILLREVLDLYKRGYSIEGISAQKKLTVNEINQILSPYMTSKGERRKVANEA